jgi:hypothetical protein
MEKVQKPIILCAIHQRQNPLKWEPLCKQKIFFLISYIRIKNKLEKEDEEKGEKKEEKNKTKKMHGSGSAIRSSQLLTRSKQFHLSYPKVHYSVATQHTLSYRRCRLTTQARSISVS